MRYYVSGISDLFFTHNKTWYGNKKIILEIFTEDFLKHFALAILGMIELSKV
jgi:hypothetical protein